MVENNYKKSKFVCFPMHLVYSFGVIFFLASVFCPKDTSSSDLHPQIMTRKIGVIADIHAASQKIRAKKTLGNTIYPDKYTNILPEVLKKMKEEEISFLIDLGDGTNSGSEKHAEAIKRMADENNFEVVWTKGNHDNDETIKIIGALDDYYFVDKDDWRIIVLDSSEGLDGKENIPGYNVYNGGIGSIQMNWLRGVLATDKQVIIAMHHPIWDKETISYIIPAYSDFEEVIEKSGNVRYVFAGHWHTPYWEKELNGIKYYGITALSLDGAEGFYKTIDLPSYYYDSYEPV